MAAATRAPTHPVPSSGALALGLCAGAGDGNRTRALSLGRSGF